MQNDTFLFCINNVDSGVLHEQHQKCDNKSIKRWYKYCIRHIIKCLYNHVYMTIAFFFFECSIVMLCYCYE